MSNLMNWLANNVPLISGIIVAFLSFLSSFIKFLNERDGAKKIKKLKTYTEIYSILPNGIDAKDSVGKLLNQEAKRILNLTTRKINGTNVAAIVFVALVGGALTYLTVLWATSSNITIVTILAWLLFVILAFFTIGISITGLKSIYEPSKNKKKL